MKRTITGVPFAAIAPSAGDTIASDGAAALAEELDKENAERQANRRSDTTADRGRLDPFRLRGALGRLIASASNRGRTGRQRWRLPGRAAPSTDRGRGLGSGPLSALLPRGSSSSPGRPGSAAGPRRPRAPA